MTSESKKEKLNKNELLANYQYLMDTIWTIYLEDGSVDILKYSMNPELVKVSSINSIYPLVSDSRTL